MPPKRKSRIRGTPKQKAPPVQTRTRQVRSGRVAKSQTPGTGGTTGPRVQGSRTTHPFTEAQVAEALGGWDLRTQPHTLHGTTGATDAIRGLDVCIQPIGSTTSPAPSANPDELIQLQAQMQRLDSELGNLRGRQSLVNSIQNGLNTRTATNWATINQGHQTYAPQPIRTAAAISTPQHEYSDGISERGAPISPAPSEVQTNMLMRSEESIPRGVDAIPPFSNRGEDFETWILRLEAVASHYKWTDNQKRGLILSNLRDEAATFIYKTLTDRERQDYKLLVKALTGRFTEIESQKVLRLKYRNLRQQPGESEQQLAARAKAIYDRACPRRDEKVRQEDLVNAFLEALLDDDQRRALEYPRVPDTIEEAALQAAHYREAARRPTSVVDDGYGYDRINRVTHNQSPDPYDEVAWNRSNVSDTGGHSIRRTLEQSRGSSAGKEKRKKAASPDDQTPTAAASDPIQTTDEKQVTLTLTALQNLLHSTAQRSNSGDRQSHDRPTNGQSQSNRQGGPIKCDNCGKNGHTAN